MECFLCYNFFNVVVVVDMFIYFNDFYENMRRFQEENYDESDYVDDVIIDEKDMYLGGDGNLRFGEDGG